MQTSGLLLGIEVIRVMRIRLGKTIVAPVASVSLKHVYAELIYWITRNIEDVCFFFKKGCFWQEAKQYF